MYRTVLDFLLTKEMQSILTERAGPGFEPRMAICVGYHGQMKLLPTQPEAIFEQENGPFEHFLAEMAYIAPY